MFSLDELVMIELAIEYLKHNMEYFDASYGGHEYSDYSELSDKVDDLQQQLRRDRT